MANTNRPGNGGGGNGGSLPPTGGGGGGMGGAFRGPEGFRPQGPGAGSEMDSGRLREQLERMEKRLDEMQRRLHGDVSGDKSNDQRGQDK